MSARVITAAACVALPLKPRGEKIERVVVITRHGDRTPAFWVDNNIGHATCSEAERAFWSKSNTNITPHRETVAEWDKWGPFNRAHVHSATGVLTSLGASTQHANGVWLRQRYIATEEPLLPDIFQPGKMTAPIPARQR
jgi:hypothetical protein